MYIEEVWLYFQGSPFDNAASLLPSSHTLSVLFVCVFIFVVFHAKFEFQCLWVFNEVTDIAFQMPVFTLSTNVPSSKISDAFISELSSKLADLLHKPESVSSVAKNKLKQKNI